MGRVAGTQRDRYVTIPEVASMTATYDRGGISFMYPENWSVMDEQLDTFPRSVSVQAPVFCEVDLAHTPRA